MAAVAAAAAVAADSGVSACDIQEFLDHQLVKEGMLHLASIQGVELDSSCASAVFNHPAALSLWGPPASPLHPLLGASAIAPELFDNTPPDHDTSPTSQENAEANQNEMMATWPVDRDEIPANHNEVGTSSESTTNQDEMTTPMSTNENYLVTSLPTTNSCDEAVPSSGTANQADEVVYFGTTLEKGETGLGITIAGYVGTRPEITLHGIFVKSIARNSAADVDGKIQINDQIVEVNGISLVDLDNHTAVEVLKGAGQSVGLRLARHIGGPVHDQLVRAVASSPPPAPPPVLLPTRTSNPTMAIRTTPNNSSNPPSIPNPNSGDPLEPPQLGARPSEPVLLELTEDLDQPSQTASPSDSLVEGTGDRAEAGEEGILFEQVLVNGGEDEQIAGPVDQDVEEAARTIWQRIIGPHNDVLVVRIHKPKDGLGMSLTGTVDIDETTGEEVRPHHYIRKLLPDGPLGRTGVLRPGDELLEANGRKLYGVKYTEVVRVLKAMPTYVQLVFARHHQPQTYSDTDDTGSSSIACSDVDEAGAHYVSGASEAISLCSSRVAAPGVVTPSTAVASKLSTASFKAKSEDSLLNTLTPPESYDGCPDDRFHPGDGEDHLSWRFDPRDSATSGSALGFRHRSSTSRRRPRQPGDGSRFRARSLEPMTGLAMWSNVPVIVELEKTSQGLGFSIVDHSDPVNPNERVIVVRSLVPNGVAHQDGRLLPGDRLLFVNDRSLDKARLADAVAVLKSAPKGRVILGVSKAVAIPEIEDYPIQMLPNTHDMETGNPALGGLDVTMVDVPPAPSSLEHLVRIERDSTPLGLEVDAVDNAKHGCQIRRVLAGAVRQNGVPQEGDFLTKVNERSLRRVNNLQAFTLLRQASSMSGDVELVYIKAEDLRAYKARHLARLREQHPLPVHNATPKPGHPESGPSHAHPTAVATSRSSEEENERTEAPPPLPPAPPVEQNAPELCDTPLPPPPPPAILGTGADFIDSWGPTRVVVIDRPQGHNLGISILGGKVASQGASPDEAVSGIFIKQITPGGLADQCGELRTGDRILSVNDIDLQKSSHDEAVETIRNATSPLRLLIQSLADSSFASNNNNNYDNEKSDRSCASSFIQDPEPLDETEVRNELAILPPGSLSSPIFSPPPPPLLADEPDSARNSVLFNQPPEITATETVANREDSPSGMDSEQIMPPESLEDEEEQPDLFGYTTNMVAQRYPPSPEDPGRQLLLIRISRGGNSSLGLRLTGNRDPNVMGVYVCGFRPNSPAQIDGRLKCGDLILEVNGQLLVGRSHLNAAPIIKQCQEAGDIVTFVVSRSPSGLATMAVPPAGSRGSVVDGVSENGDGVPRVDDLSSYGEVLRVTLQKGTSGFGFFIMEGSFLDEPGIYVKQVTADGPAAKEGTLRQGDRILCVNDTNVVNLDYDRILALLRSCSTEVQLTVGRVVTSQNESPSCPANHTAPATILDKLGSRRESNTSGSGVQLPATNRLSPTPAVGGRRVSGASSHNSGGTTTTTGSSGSGPVPPPGPEVTGGATSDPATCPIVPGQETVIELVKDKEQGLGLSIVGGSDTILGTVIIHEVYEGGAAALDSRLWAGDRILAVNGVDLRSAGHERATEALRTASQRVRLRVYRDKKPLSEDDLYEVIRVELTKRAGRGLGMEIIARQDTGVCIGELLKSGAAEQDGRIKPGDLIIDINGTNMRGSSRDQVATVLKSLTGKVVLTVGRLKSDPRPQTALSAKHNTKSSKGASPNLPPSKSY